jgi:hypothetical protein
MEEILRLSISEARARLPELAQLAMGSPGRVIIIEHRDLKERLVLTTESTIKALEAGVNKKPKTPTFKLAGSITSDLTDEEMETAIAEMRRKWAAESARRIDRFLND